MQIIKNLQSMSACQSGCGNPVRDLWDTSPMLCQLSYEVKSIRVCGISELSLVRSIPMCSYDHEQEI